MERSPPRLRATLTRLALTLAALGALAVAGPAGAQTPEATRDDAPLVFLDCRRCDDAHIRQEIPFVNYLRDASGAQVHVLVTDEATGAGGRRYTLAFLGREEFAGVENTLTYTSLPTETTAERRDALTETLKLGLAPYVARTSLAPYLTLSFDGPEGGEPLALDDPWNNWTFEIYAGGNFRVESSQAQANARYGFFADRVTERWKIRVRPYFNNNVRIIRQEDEEDVRVDLRRHGLESYFIRSLGGHMGAGIFGEYITNTTDNLQHRVTVTPAIEYSVYPYEEATRRQITLTYRAGYEYADYFEETIFEKTRESLLNHALSGSVQFVQPWGSISSRMTAFTYLHDTSYHRLSFDGDLRLRIGGGLSLSLGANYQKINDQLSLPRGDASLEDILLDRRQLATSYRGSGNIGLTYTFGSIYSNVVNPRL